MGYDVLKRKCGAHNRIIGNRETCPQCASDLRAKMGPKPQGDDRDVQWDAGGTMPTLSIAPLGLSMADQMLCASRRGSSPAFK